jgi:hypothetical protein
MGFEEDALQPASRNSQLSWLFLSLVNGKGRPSNFAASGRYEFVSVRSSSMIFWHARILEDFAPFVSGGYPHQNPNKDSKSWLSHSHIVTRLCLNLRSQKILRPEWAVRVDRYLASTDCNQLKVIKHTSPIAMQIFETMMSPCWTPSPENERPKDKLINLRARNCQEMIQNAHLITSQEAFQSMVGLR